MNTFYIAIAIGVLLLIIWALAAYCLDLGKENRRQRDQIKSLYNIKRVPVTPTIISDETLMDAIESGMPEEQDYSGMFNPYVSRESRAK